MRTLPYIVMPVTRKYDLYSILKIYFHTAKYAVKETNATFYPMNNAVNKLTALLVAFD